MNLNFTFLVFLMLLGFVSGAQTSDDYVTITGHVTDYQNNPLDSVSVTWQDKRFTKAVAETTTDRKGYYEIKLKKGRYYCMSALNMEQYIVTGSTLPAEDLRLEFWGWNYIVDRDTVFNMQYHRLEVYGINVFSIQGGTPGYMIYCRPMSLTKTLDYGLPSKGKVRLAPSPENMKIKVTVNGEEVAVLNKQEVEEYWSETESTNAYLLTVDLPKKRNALPYLVFRVQMTDLENGDMGEATYFLEKKKYVD